MNPEISIIVPVYNTDRYLESCINSIINQSFYNFELILIDDGSEDDSGKICDKYANKDKRIKVIHKKNEGVSVARNIGIDLSKGRYIMFCDSDDFVKRDWCKRLYDLQKNNLNSICLCGFTTINFRGDKCEYIDKVLDKNKKINHINIKDFFLLYEKHLMNSPCNKIYQSEIIKENNIKFNENITLGEDLLFNLKYFEFVKGDIVVLNECKYNYILRNNESLDNKYYKDLFDIYSMLYEFLYNHMIIFKSDIDIYLEKFYSSYFYMLNRVLKNTFHINANMNFIEKIKYNSKVMKSEEFKKCLRYSNLDKMNIIHKKLYLTGNYIPIYIYENLSKFKSKFIESINVVKYS